jgi:glycosyltransferase involved in cell wall biosynthesis
MQTVLYVVSRLVPRGPIRVLLNIIENLDRSSFRPVICTLSPEADDSMMPDFEAQDVQIHQLSLSRWEVLFRGNEALQSCYEKTGASVVHTHGIRPDMLAARALPSDVVLATIHNYPFDDYVMKFGSVLGRAMAWKHLRVFRKLSHVAACSSSIAKRVKPHGVNASVVRNGISINDYRPASPEKRRKLRHKFGIDDETPMIVWVGAMIDLKSPNTLLDAHRIFRQTHDAEVFFLGDGNRRKESEERARGVETLHIEGYVTNVREYLQAADIYVSTSTSEGLPNAVVEALSAACPACLSDIDPHREILSLDPEAGVLFQTGDAEDLARSLQVLMDSDRGVRAHRARALVEDHLSARQMSEQYQVLYRQMSAAKSQS